MQMDKFTLNIRGRLVEFDKPVVMGILNATPDSFYQTGRGFEQNLERALQEGADMLDIGAYSTRPGASPVNEDEEIRRLLDALRKVRRADSDIPVSVDTFRASVARAALDEGADIVNDISAGTADDGMFPLIAATSTPYIIMHMRGTPQTMQSLTDYSIDGGVVAAVMTFLAGRMARLHDMGVHDVIVDPGFGFAKTPDQNYELLRSLPLLQQTLGHPMLVGLSRKSMFYKPLGLTPGDVLPATCAANLVALQAGAAILRVHDVGAACQVRHVFCN